MRSTRNWEQEDEKKLEKDSGVASVAGGKTRREYVVLEDKELYKEERETNNCVEC